MFLVFVSGCAPSASVWKDGMNWAIGKDFNSIVTQTCRPGCISFWSPVNHNEVIDKVVEEPQGNRHYITWWKWCKYSVLVSPVGQIISWQYETNRPESCYVF